MSKTIEVEVPDDDFEPLLVLAVGILTKRSDGHNLAVATHVQPYDEGIGAITDLLGHPPQEHQTLQVFASLIGAVSAAMNELVGGKRGLPPKSIIIMPFGIDPRGMAS